MSLERSKQPRDEDAELGFADTVDAATDALARAKIEAAINAAETRDRSKSVAPQNGGVADDRKDRAK